MYLDIFGYILVFFRHGIFSVFFRLISTILGTSKLGMPQQLKHARPGAPRGRAGQVGPAAAW